MPAATVVPVGIDETVRHLADADVLVHTGSSLAAAAALVARGPQLYFQSPPKEGPGAPEETYSLAAAVTVDGNGRPVRGRGFRFAGGGGRGGDADARARDRQVGRFVRALYARRHPGRVGRNSSGPGASAGGAAAGAAARGGGAEQEAMELADLLGHKVRGRRIAGRIGAQMQESDR